MLNSFELVLTSCLSNAGFIPYTDFSDVDTIAAKANYLAFYSIKDVKYSGRVYAFDNSEYGLEVSGCADIKLLGKKNYYKDFSEIDNRSFSFINSLITSDKIVISSLFRSEVEADANSERLKSVISFNFKLLVTESIKEE